MQFYLNKVFILSKFSKFLTYKRCYALSILAMPIPSPPPPRVNPGAFIKKKKMQMSPVLVQKNRSNAPGCDQGRRGMPHPWAYQFQQCPPPPPPPQPITGQNDKCPRVGAKSRSNAPGASVIKDGGECPIPGPHPQAHPEINTAQDFIPHDAKGVTYH